MARTFIGKPAAKVPSLVREAVKKASDADLTDLTDSGGKDKNAFANKGLTSDQVRMVVAYIHGTQK